MLRLCMDPFTQVLIKFLTLQITIVGRVVRVSETATNLDLVVDDGTGTLEAKLYVDAEEEQNVRQFCQGGFIQR